MPITMEKYMVPYISDLCLNKMNLYIKSMGGIAAMQKIKVGRNRWIGEYIPKSLFAIPFGWKKLDSIRRVFSYRSKKTRVCNLFRIHAFSSLLDLLNGSDAIFVSSSTNSHFEVVSEALKHGKDVYVDKPLALPTSWRAWNFFKY